MVRSVLTLVVACLALVMGTTSAQAVTIDLTSPQAGQTVQPGDTVEVTATVTNDTAKKDNISVKGSATVEGMNINLQATAKFRVKLGPGESYSQTFSETIPADLPITEPVTVTIQAVATGKPSKTEDSDSLWIIVAP